MCPTPIGRIETRVATLIGPALLATLVSLATGRPDWIVLIGVFLLMGVALDAGLYVWLLKYQPPWMTGILALGEFGLLYVLANVLQLGLTPAEAIGLYWVSWALATATRIAILPIVSLTYIESAGEFRRIEWSVPPSQASLPLLASRADTDAGPGALVQEASGVHARPLERKPSLSGVHSAGS
jgi:hypothetical protein